MDVRVEAECPEVDVVKGQSSDPWVVVQKNEQQEPQVEAERQVQQQPKVNGGDKDEQQQEEQQSQTRPDVAGGEGQQTQIEPPQQPNDQPQGERSQDPPNAANVAATPKAASDTVGRSHKKHWLWVTILSVLLIVAAGVCVVMLLSEEPWSDSMISGPEQGSEATQNNSITNSDFNSLKDETSGEELTPSTPSEHGTPTTIKEEKVVKYRCDTVPTYDADDASTCGGGSLPDSACFTLRRGASWQCFQKSQKSPTPCDGVRLDGKNEFYKGACVFKGNDDYQDAMDAQILKALDSFEEQHEAPKKPKNPKESEEPKKPKKSTKNLKQDEEKHEEPKKAREREEEPTKNRAISLRNLKWRWAEHKIPGLGYYVPRMFGGSWNVPADRDALVKELETKMQDPKAAAKQYETRAVEFADVDYPERRMTFADYTKALDWLALESNIQSRDDL